MSGARTVMWVVAALGIALGKGAAAQDTARVVSLELKSRTFGNTRTVRVHLPPGYHDAANAARRYPVLYMNDGFAVFSPGAWNAPRAVDSLVAAGRVAPLILVGIDNAASIPGSTAPNRDRANEYLPYPDATEPGLPDPQGAKYPDFVTGEVLPLVARRFRVSKRWSDTGLGGSSYGGVAALHAAIRKPGVFGRLLLESTPLFLFDGRLVTEAKRLERWPERLYVGLGTHETDDPAILERARRGEEFVAFAREKLGVERFRFHLVDGATHTSGAWRERFPVALQFLFPPAASGAGVSRPERSKS